MSDFATDKPSNKAEPPGQIIKRLMDERGWNQGELASKTGYSRPTINLAINGHKPITEELSRRLGAVFGLGADFLTIKQTEYFDEQETNSARAAKDNVTHLSAARAGRRAPDSQRFSSAILVDHQIRAALQAGEFVIDPIDAGSIQPASVDLRIGGHLVLSDHDRPVHLNPGGVIELQPGARALIQTLESISLSASYIARIGAISTLARHAIFISTGLQVDPEYKGRIFVSACNMGLKPFPLRYGSPFLSLEIHRLPMEPTTGYAGPHQGGWEISTFDAEVLLPAHPVLELGDDDVATITDLGHDFFTLRKPLEIPIRFTGGSYEASLWEPRLSAIADRPDAAVEALVHRILIRFETLLDNSSPDPKIREERRAWSRLIFDTRFVPFVQVREIALMLGAEIIGPETSRSAMVTDGSGRNILLDLPAGKGMVPLKELAETLGITAGQSRALISGSSGAEEYLAWTSGA